MEAETKWKLGGPAPLNSNSTTCEKAWLTPTTISGQQQFDMYYSIDYPQVLGSMAIMVQNIFSSRSGDLIKQ